ncbi:uncharacterized protein B0H64DRAFT_371350 [Chaetomium fimeti]|uniref:Uncharacterized protein n=1 Tax=Chaetomium fimeti TaxID=1854472 RepID=A0AAE0LVD1_9PEZI|nr:hypothetical protein B0H64DRAFT_371350 [Chaetomium fimeti]
MAAAPGSWRAPPRRASRAPPPGSGLSVRLLSFDRAPASWATSWAGAAHLAVTPGEIESGGPETLYDAPSERKPLAALFPRPTPAFVLSASGHISPTSVPCSGLKPGGAALADAEITRIQHG